jgi:hypothetical protein
LVLDTLFIIRYVPCGEKIFESPSKDWICGRAIVRHNSKIPVPIRTVPLLGTHHGFVSLRYRNGEVAGCLEPTASRYPELHLQRTPKSTFTVRPSGTILLSKFRTQIKTYNLKCCLLSFRFSKLISCQVIAISEH